VLLRATRIEIKLKERVLGLRSRCIPGCRMGCFESRPISAPSLINKMGELIENCCQDPRSEPDRMHSRLVQCSIEEIEAQSRDLAGNIQTQSLSPRVSLHTLFVLPLLSLTPASPSRMRQCSVAPKPCPGGDHGPTRNVRPPLLQSHGSTADPFFFVLALPH